MKVLNNKDFWVWPLKKWWVYLLGILYFIYNYEPSPIFFMWESFFGELTGSIFLVIFLTWFFRFIYLKIRKKSVS